VRMIRDAGAREVHLRITAPPTRGSCYYGVDTPTREELIAHRFDPVGIRQYLEADSVGYLSLESLRKAEGDDLGRFCEACFSLDYPVDPRPEDRSPQVPLFEGGG